MRHHLAEKKIDTFLVLIEENRRYLSGFSGEDTLFEESAGALFITDDRILLATDPRFELQAGQEAPMVDVYCCREGLAAALPEILGMLHTRVLGFESARLSCLEFDKFNDRLAGAGLHIQLVGTHNMVETLRVLKDEKEIATIKASLEIAENVFDGVTAALTPGITEKEAAWMLEKEMRETGADALSFPIITAFGPNSALPHAIPGNRRLQKGEPILFDWGARLNGYCSDISRTLIVGKPDKTFETVYGVVLDAQRKAIDSIRPGVSGKEIDGIARTHIDSNGYKGKFGHGLGHGVGMAVHESPRLSPTRDDILEPGMVVTVEPGIYLPGWGGIRIENMVVVRNDGPEILNRLETDLFYIEP